MSLADKQARLWTRFLFVDKRLLFAEFEWYNYKKGAVENLIMPSKKRLVKKLEKLANEFLKPDKRKALLESLRGDKTDWFLWCSKIKAVMKNIDTLEATKLTGYLLLLEKKPKSKFRQDNLKRYLINQVEFYKHYDFTLEQKLRQRKYATKKLWTSKILRLFISRSFLGLILVGLIIGFIFWFYLDRAGCLEFVRGVVGPFLKAIR